MSLWGNCINVKTSVGVVGCRHRYGHIKIEAVDSVSIVQDPEDEMAYLAYVHTLCSQMPAKALL